MPTQRTTTPGQKRENPPQSCAHVSATFRHRIWLCTAKSALKSAIRCPETAEVGPHIRLGRYVRFSADELTTWWRSRARGPWRDRGAAAAQASSVKAEGTRRSRG